MTTNLQYTTLCTRLGLSSTIDLEHLITQAIYSNLLTATLNPSSQTVLITSVSPLRDLAPGSVGVMISELDAWSLRCTGALADLDAEVAKVKENAAKRKIREERMERQVKAVMDADGKAGGGGNASGGGRHTRGKARKEEDDVDDEMDVDGMDTAGGKKSGGLGGFMGRLGRSSR